MNAKRKITSLGKTNKTKLRTFFNETSPIKVRTIKQITKLMGTYNDAETWLVLTYEYNEALNDPTVIVPYEFRCKIRWKGEVDWIIREFNGTVTGKRSEIMDKIQIEYNKWKEWIENNSAFDSKDFEEPILGQEQIIAVSGGKILTKNIMKIKMKRMGAFKLDNNFSGDTSWDRQQNTCVFDYLFNKYCGLSGIKKFMVEDREKANDNMNIMFNDCEDEINNDALTDGVSIEGLIRFCEKFGIGLIALQKDEKLIKYIKSTNKNLPTLMFIISNNHFYPIEDKHKRKSVSEIHKEKDKTIIRPSNWQSDEYVNEIKKPRGNMNIMYPKENEITGNAWAMEQIIKRNTVPNDRTIQMSENQINNFIIGEDFYITQPPSNIQLEFCEINGIEYQGQTEYSILTELMNEDQNYLQKNMNSNYNKQVSDILELQGIKYRTHYGATKDLSALLKEEDGEIIINKKFKTGEAIATDIRRCYAKRIYDPYDIWLKFSVEDEFEPFQDVDGDLPSGLYITITDDNTLLHQTNIYENKILDKARKEKIPLVITYQLIHKKKYANEKVMDKTFFHSLLKKINEKTKGKKMEKLMVNMISGKLGKTADTHTYVKIDTDFDTVTRDITKDGEFINYNDDLVLNTLIGEDDKKLYIFGNKVQTKYNENTLPMYIQILCWANMMLYDMGKEIGGEIIFRHTDCVVSIGGKLNKENKKYQLEQKNYNFTSMMKTDRHVKFPEINNDWKINTELINSNDWENIINYAMENGGLLITGRAGTGKSFIPKSAFNSGKMELGVNTVSGSFTNKASRNIQGTTLHKLLKITRNGEMPKSSIKAFKKYDYFVVDEISMIPNHLWKKLMLIKKSNPSLIFILMGDWRQIPPIDVNRIIVTDNFNHPIVKYLTNNNKIELTVKQRYDTPLWNYLEKGINNSDWNGLIEKKVSIDEVMTSKNISFFNNTRIEINKLCMKEEIKSKEFKYIDYSEEIPNNKSQDIYIYNGLPLMSWKNNKALKIINSEEFTVKSFNETHIILKRNDEGKDIELPIEKLHDNFVANYCATAHKSQGDTYTGKVILWNWTYMISDDNLCYTATSRATSLTNLIVSLGIQF